MCGALLQGYHLSLLRIWFDGNCSCYPLYAVLAVFCLVRSVGSPGLLAAATSPMPCACAGRPALENAAEGTPAVCSHGLFCSSFGHYSSSRAGELG